MKLLMMYLDQSQTFVLRLTKMHVLSKAPMGLVATLLGFILISTHYGCALQGPPKVVGARPNIVVLLSDDMGWADPGFHGGNAALTPNMDRLAQQGMRMTRFYTHSVCAPTRAALLTGRYAFRTWMDWRSEDFGKPTYLKKLGLKLAHNERGEPTRMVQGMDTRERTVAEALRDAGYFTAIAGKWHPGEWLPEHLPMGQGFQHQYGH